MSMSMSMSISILPSIFSIIMYMNWTMFIIMIWWIDELMNSIQNIMWMWIISNDWMKIWFFWVDLFEQIDVDWIIESLNH
jgi:hypothetical protein